MRLEGPRDRVLAAALSASIGACLVGCIPIPFATPPSKATVGYGGAFGEIEHRDVAAEAPEDEGDAVSSGSRGVFTGRVGAHPMQGLDDMRRPFDVGGGYVFELPLDDTGSTGRRHGMYLSVDYFLPLFDPGEPSPSDVVVRTPVRAIGEVLFRERDGDVGAGVGASGGIELVYFVRDEGIAEFDPEGGFVGLLRGELAIGLEVDVGFRSFGDVRYGVVSAQLSIRAPLSLGMLFFPITNALR